MQMKERERERAGAIREQQRRWEKSLGVRIRMQKAVAAANALPSGRAYERACGEGGAAAHFRSLGRACSGLLCDLLDCQSRLLDLCGARDARAGGGAPGAGPRPSDHARLMGGEAGEDGDGAAWEARWRHLSATHADAMAYVDDSLDAWQRKAMVATGGAAAAATAMRLQSFVGRSFAERVASHIQSSDAKLRRKMHLTHAESPAVLGGAAPRGAAAGSLNLETFDDSDFYGQLLQEFLEGKGMRHAADAPGGAPAPKRRRQVDRNASKGRKLRFQVMEKLVNFMSPVEGARPVLADQLFTNLFGGGR